MAYGCGWPGIGGEASSRRRLPRSGQSFAENPLYVAGGFGRW